MSAECNMDSVQYLLAGGMHRSSGVEKVPGVV